MIFDPTVTLSFVLALATVVFTWWRTRDSNTDARFKAGSDRMDRHETRLNSVEQTLRTLPAKDDLHELQLSIAGLNGKLETLTAVMDGNTKIMGRLEAIVGRHEEHLLDGAKR